MKTLIIAGFPGVGKSYYHSNHNPDLQTLDSDSSLFSKEKDFPGNYIEHIKKHIGIVDLIFVSTHKIVREALVKNEIHFLLVYPNRNLKELFSSKYMWRKNTQAFMQLLDDNWDRWIDEMEEQEGCTKYILQEEETLSDIMPLLLKS